MAPLISLLLSQGLGLVANAALVKGKEWVQKETGINLDAGELTPEKLSGLKQYQLENEPELRRLQVEDNRIAAQVRMAELDADKSFQAEAQATARVESQSADEYVRRTRPSLARKSFYAGAVYAVVTGAVFPVVNALASAKLPGLDAYILGALYAPCLTFMGVRSVEAFSKGGKR